MNAITRHTTILAVAAAAFATFGGQAHASEATYELPQLAVSAMTRAEVRAELLQALREGTLLATEADFQRRSEFLATKSRAQVSAELRADAGAAHALTAEPHGFDAPIGSAHPAQAQAINSARR